MKNDGTLWRGRNFSLNFVALWTARTAGSGTVADSLDERHKLNRVEWLGQVHVRAVVIAFKNVLILRLRGQHDHGEVLKFRIFAEILENLKSVHVRHHDVQHDEAWLLGFDLFKALLTVVGCYNLIAILLQIDLDKAHNMPLVVTN